MGSQSKSATSPLLVISAHAGDFVWRAAGAIALAAGRGDPVKVVCLSYGELRDRLPGMGIEYVQYGEA